MASELALVFCFIGPLSRLVQYSFSSELYSYIILVPLISTYLIWQKRKSPVAPSSPNRRLAVSIFTLGVITIATYWSARSLGVSLETEDSLALTTLSFVLMFLGICAWFIGTRMLNADCFALCFLLFMVPLPVVVRSWMEGSLQRFSALAALGMFKLAGTPVFFSSPSLQLPDITLQIAPECSGIHSSVALFITSLVAGHIFLRSNWKRSALALVVLPLGVLRNGFRVFTIGELCVHIGPEMIDSYVHHRGGPIFFVISLVPFLIFLFLLIKSDKCQMLSGPQFE